MNQYARQRKVNRIRLFPSLTAALDGITVSLVEVSLRGARVHSEVPLEPRRIAKLRFSWQDDQLEVEATVKRCYRDQHFGPAPRYELGLKFESIDGASFFSIYRLVDCHVKDALHRQAANANGQSLLQDDSPAQIMPSAEDRALLRVRDDRDRGYTRYSLIKGKWSRETTWHPEQPEDGFTIWAFEDGGHLEELCRVYESSDAAVRDVIRRCATLSLVVDDTTFPPQYFEP